MSDDATDNTTFLRLPSRIDTPIEIDVFCMMADHIAIMREALERIAKLGPEERDIALEALAKCPEPKP